MTYAAALTRPRDHCPPAREATPASSSSEIGWFAVWMERQSLQARCVHKHDMFQKLMPLLVHQLRNLSAMKHGWKKDWGSLVRATKLIVAFNIFLVMNTLISVLYKYTHIPA